MEAAVNPITCMFVELCYRKPLSDTVQSRNSLFAAKALELRGTVARNVDWHCDTFATLSSSYQLLEDSLFAPLIMEAGQCVAEFALNYGVKESAPLRCIDGWVNVAHPGEHQEVHIHPGSHFSAVYYVDAPDLCGNLVFRSHESLTDMQPLPTSGVAQANAKTHFHVPKTGDLLIFRSNLMHMVAPNKSSSPRISVALNFVFG